MKMLYKVLNIMYYLRRLDDLKVILNETKLPLPSKDNDKEYSDVKLLDLRLG